MINEYNQPIPNQYKRLTDQCVINLVNTAFKLLPVIDELGNSFEIITEKFKITIDSKEGINDSESKNREL